jgi:hypothetical protein
MRCAVVAVLLGSYLVAPVVAQTVVRIYGTVSDGTFLPVLVDSTGRLLVTISGTITPTEINLPASTCADPALSETGALTTGIAFTATPSILDCVNGTAVVTTSGTAVTSTVPYRGPDGTKTAPSMSFSGAATWGFYRDNNFGLVASVADTDIWTTDSAALVLSSSKSLLWGSSTFSAPDVSVSRGATNRSDWGAGDFLRIPAVAVGDLPTCNAGAQGSRHTVNDANAAFTAGIGAVVAAGGANVVPVFCDGTNWRIG